MVDNVDRIEEARTRVETMNAGSSDNPYNGGFSPRKPGKTTSEQVNDQLIEKYSRFPECKLWIEQGYDNIYNYRTDDKEAKDLVRKNKAEGIDTKVWPTSLSPNGETRGEGYVGVFEKRK